MSVKAVFTRKNKTRSGELACYPSFSLQLLFTQAHRHGRPEMGPHSWKCEIQELRAGNRRFLFNPLRTADGAPYSFETGAACICAHPAGSEWKAAHTLTSSLAQQKLPNMSLHFLICWFLWDFYKVDWVENFREKSKANVTDVCVLSCHNSGTSLERFRTPVRMWKQLKGLTNKARRINRKTQKK